MDSGKDRAAKMDSRSEPHPTEAEAVLLVEVEGCDAEVQGCMSEIKSIIEAHGVLQVRGAQGADERRKLWAGRKGAFGAMGRVAPDLYVADAVVPRTKLRELVRVTSQICADRNLRLANVFHAGDGNLHPNICYDRRDEEEVERVLEAGRLILEACVRARNEHPDDLRELPADDDHDHETDPRRQQPVGGGKCAATIAA